jgi:pSer/pThr/pTyr-binding forkhead associated (FHA) protein
MGVLLEINAGPMAGKKIAIVAGQTVTFGRAAGRAEFPLPHDTFMSGVHFAVECGSGGCRVQDRKSSNGTFLNGAKIQDAMLANGDEIKGGQTIFAVKIVADAKLAALVMPQEDAPISVPQTLQPQAVAPAAPELAPSPRPPRVEPQVSPEAMRNANLEKKDAAYRNSAPESSARGSSPKPEAPASIAHPPVEEPPGSHAIPSVPHASASPPVAVPKSLSGGENPPGAAVTPPRGSAPPLGVASHIARKFGDGPLERGDGLRGAAFSVMGWSFPAAPAEWHVQEGFGLQQSGHEDFPSSLAATEELLGGITLQQFVESQISMLRGYLRNPKIEPTMPPRVGGAEESMAMDVRHSTKDGRELVYRRIYARSGASVGVLTVTTLAADLPQVLVSLQPLLDGAAFRSTVSN